MINIHNLGADDEDEVIVPTEAIPTEAIPTEKIVVEEVPTDTVVGDGLVHIDNEDFAFALSYAPFGNGTKHFIQVIYKGTPIFPVITAKVPVTENNKARDASLLDTLLSKCGFNRDNKEDKIKARNIIASIPDAAHKFLEIQKQKQIEESKIRHKADEERRAREKEEKSRVIVNIGEQLIDGAETASLTFRYDSEKQYSGELAINRKAVFTTYTDGGLFNINTILDKLKKYLVEEMQVPEDRAIGMLKALRKASLHSDYEIKCLNPEIAKTLEHKSKLEVLQSQDQYSGLIMVGDEEKYTYFNLYIPEEYKLENANGIDIGACGAVIHHYYNKFTKNWEDDKIADCKLMVTGYMKSYDSKTDMVELSYIAPDTATRSTEKRTIVVPFEAIKSHKKFESEVIPKGVAVVSSEITAVIKYLSECINANYNVDGSRMRTASTYERLGWKGEKFDLFNSGDRFYNGAGGEDFELGSCVFVDTVNTKIQEKQITTGTLEGYVSAVKDLMAYQRLHFLTYKAFDTLLLKKLNAKACTVGLEYNSSTGKTLAFSVLASMFGHPVKLLLSGDTSVTALYARLKVNSDHPHLIDDTINMKESMRKEIGYIATNGTEKDRGETDGKLRGTVEIWCNIFITSELPIISSRAMNGANYRAIIVKIPIFPDIEPELIQNSKDGMIENHGHILQLFLNKINKYRFTLKSWYDKALKELNETTTDKGIRRQAMYYATAYVAGLMLEEIYKEIGLTTFDALETVKMFWEECALGHSETLGDKALAVVYNHFNKRRGTSFVMGKNTKPFIGVPDIEGYHNGTYLDVNENVVTKVLHENDFDNIEPVFTEWRNKGVIKTNVNAFVYSTKHWVKGNNEKQESISMIRIVLEKTHEILNLSGEIKDDFDALTEEEKAAVQAAVEEENTEFEGVGVKLEQKRKSYGESLANLAPKNV